MDTYTKEQRRDYNRERRAANKAAGLCQDCGKTRPARERTLCSSCLAARRERWGTIKAH